MAVRVLYYHPLSLTFTSAQTLQVVRDYAALSRRGHEVELFGYFHDDASLRQIRQYLADAPGVTLHVFAPRSALSSLRLSWAFTRALWRRPAPLLVTRHFRRLRRALRMRTWAPVAGVLHEMHEESFVYRFKNLPKEAFEATLARTDALLFTNASQVDLWREEFDQAPPVPHIVLPNGVDFDRFHQARFRPDGVLTYTGQFNPWKNTDLLFAALAKLPKRFTLRIAGGKNDDKSRAYIQEMGKKFGVSDRIDFRGFVPGDRLVQEVLDGSETLLLPLGENLPSCYLTSPMKLFEYMATHIPVVAVDCPSVRANVPANTLFFAKPDPQSFAQAILHSSGLEARSRQGRIQRMNDHARRFDYARRAEAFEDFLQQTFPEAR